MTTQNPFASEYRHRIHWIKERLEEMGQESNGMILRADAEAIIYNRYDCAPDSVRRYLKTLEGKRFLEQNDTHIIIPHLKDLKK